MSLPAGFASYGVVGGKLYSREDVFNYLMSQGDSDEEGDEYELEEDELEKPLEAKDEDNFKKYIKITILALGSGHNNVAVLYTILGELQLKIGKLDDAEQAFKTSLDTYKNHAFYPSQEYDCATVREHLAQVAEARGELKGAKKMRLSCGKEKLRCANINVSISNTFPDFSFDLLLKSYVSYSTGERVTFFS